MPKTPKEPSSELWDERLALDTPQGVLVAAGEILEAFRCGRIDSSELGSVSKFIGAVNGAHTVRQRQQVLDNPAIGRPDVVTPRQLTSTGPFGMPPGEIVRGEAPPKPAMAVLRDGEVVWEEPKK